MRNYLDTTPSFHEPLAKAVGIPIGYLENRISTKHIPLKRNEILFGGMSYFRQYQKQTGIF